MAGIERSKQSRTKSSRGAKKYQYRLIPLALIISVVPLIVRMAVIGIPDSIMDYVYDSLSTDFFSYNKGIALIFLTLVSIFVLLSGVLTRRSPLRRIERDHRWKIWLPLVIVATGTVLSTVLSQYTAVALSGFPGRFEGLWIWLCYLSLVYLVYQQTTGEENVRFLLIFLIVSSSLLGILGIFQFFGFDFFRSILGKWLIVPSQYAENREILNFQFGPHTIYSTMFNTNNVGSYFVMLFPLSITLFLIAEKKTMRLASGLFSAVMFFNLVGSRSRAGWVGGVVALILLAMLLHKILSRQKKYVFILATAFVSIGLFMNLIAGGTLAGKMNLQGISQEEVSLPLTNDSASNVPKLKDMYTRADGLDIIWTNDTTSLFFSDKGFESAQNSNDEDIPFVKKIDLAPDETVVIPANDSNLPIEIITSTEHPVVVIRSTEGEHWQLNFTMTDYGFKAIGPNRLLVDLYPPDSIGFKGYENVGSGRGYIFSRSIPLLKNTLLIGNGPDTYPMYFPQHDYVGKILYLNGPGTLVDKPHNVYLQIGINQGVPALLAYLALLFFYGWESFWLYFKRLTKEPSFLETVGVGCLVAVVGYSVAGFFNDSIVSVAPVFWVLLGLGISVNAMIKNGEDGKTA